MLITNIFFFLLFLNSVLNAFSFRIVKSRDRMVRVISFWSQQNCLLVRLKAIADHKINVHVDQMQNIVFERWKTLWEKEKMLFTTTIFSVFQKLFLLGWLELRNSALKGETLKSEGFHCCGICRHIISRSGYRMGSLIVDPLFDILPSCMVSLLQLNPFPNDKL